MRATACHWHHFILLFIAEKHSLYYIYTGLSKPVNQPGIYQFSAMGLLDDRQIDSYNSEEQRKIPKQQWMKEKMQEDYWEKGTQSRKGKEQWFNGNVIILIKYMNQSKSVLLPPPCRGVRRVSLRKPNYFVWSSKRGHN
uniref:MHC class I-like antigen recognition-like domain-containing protein n=1 Tax=Sinocyclocheilus anshuiensis TaxID=1608454 RepID=A0A671PG50_9TELE